MLFHNFAWSSRDVAFWACTMFTMPPSVLARTEQTAKAAASVLDESHAPLVVADDIVAEPAFTVEEREELVGPITDAARDEILFRRIGERERTGSH
jgi:hypothetical protein